MNKSDNELSRKTADAGNFSGQDEVEKFDECPVCYQEFTYRTRLPDCGHEFCFLCIKGVALRNGSCPLCRKSIPRSLFLDPVLRRSTDQVCEFVSVIAYFTYQALNISYGSSVLFFFSQTFTQNNKIFNKARYEGWWRYEPRHESEIEKAYQSGLHSIDLLIAGSLYSINFDSMCQYKKNLDRFSREIKRIEKGETPLDGVVHGIAGLRTPTEQDPSGS
ncbi:unnamed protein product [Thelazia callipaeda]|uniref:E3 ubiquitin-protein ligase n=1 Tax=Thelazia callipaeda TaxID=103827 RepID=A0A0N5D6N2_THECL|nr:unnamed protein product [Thelazia callipaeda]